MDLVETSGAESTLYLRTAQQRLAIRMAQAWEKGHEGRTCSFYVHPSKLFFFEAEFEKRLN